MKIVLALMAVAVAMGSVSGADAAEGNARAENPRRGTGVIFKATGHIAASDPIQSLTEIEFSFSTCPDEPKTNGEDGYAFVGLPARVGSGSAIASARSRNATGPYDLDMYFYDQDCSFLGRAVNDGTDEISVIPEKTRHIVVVDNDYMNPGISTDLVLIVKAPADHESTD